MLKQIADAFGVDPTSLELITKENEMNIKDIALKEAPKHWHRDSFNNEYFDVAGFAEALLAEVQRQNKPVASVSVSGKRGNYYGVGLEFEYDEALRKQVSPSGKPTPLFLLPPSIEAEREKVAVWQPIETAPKDGTNILAYTNDGYRFPLVSQCVWDDGWWPDVWESPEDPLNPTHWMPLPKAPANGGGL